MIGNPADRNKLGIRKQNVPGHPRREVCFWRCVVGGLATPTAERGLTRATSFSPRRKWAHPEKFLKDPDVSVPTNREFRFFLLLSKQKVDISSNFLWAICIHSWHLVIWKTIVHAPQREFIGSYWLFASVSSVQINHHGIVNQWPTQ